VSGTHVLLGDRPLDAFALFRAVVLLPAVSAERLCSGLDPLVGSSDGKERTGCKLTFEVAVSTTPFALTNIQ